MENLVKGIDNSELMWIDYHGLSEKISNYKNKCIEALEKKDKRAWELYSKFLFDAEEKRDLILNGIDAYNRNKEK